MVSRWCRLGRGVGGAWYPVRAAMLLELGLEKLALSLSSRQLSDNGLGLLEVLPFVQDEQEGEGC